MKLEPDPQTLRITRGRAWSETWVFVDDTSGEDVRADLTGCTGTFTVYVFTGAEPIEGSVDIGDDGEITLGLTEEQVAELAGIRAAHWELFITDSLGETHDANGPVWMGDAA